MRVIPRTRLVLVASAVFLSVPIGAPGSAAAAKAPPNAMFKKGYNKCKLASLAAINRTTGKKFAKAKFDGKTCTWSSSDGNFVILLDTHPVGYLLVVPAVGTYPSEVVKAVTIRGASKALLDTHSYANTRRYQKDLFAEFPQGVVQVSMDYSTALPDAKLVAVLKLVTRT